MTENKFEEWNGWTSKYHALGFFIWSFLSKYKGFDNWQSSLEECEIQSIKSEIISIIKKWEDFK